MTIGTGVLDTAFDANPASAEAEEFARAALVDAGQTGVGDYLGAVAEDEFTVTHRFAATLAGYRGWQWAVVVAHVPHAPAPTISESALLPGPDALVAPAWVPWKDRVRPGDLGPGDLLAPPDDDPRTVPGFMASGDPAVDDVAAEVGLGRKAVMSRQGRVDAAERWHSSDFGPHSEMAKAAPSICALCAFYLPLDGVLRSSFGVCGNEMSADGRVVHARYGCGAHSDTRVPPIAELMRYEPFDDAAVELIGKGSRHGQRHPG